MLKRKQVPERGLRRPREEDAGDGAGAAGKNNIQINEHNLQSPCGQRNRGNGF